MKASVEQYARALLAATKNLSAATSETVCQRFVALLNAEGRLSWWPSIEAAFVEAWEREQGLAALELYSPRSLSNEELAQLTKVFEAKLQCRVTWKIIFDKSLIAGFKIKHRDRVWDLSLLEGLNQLRWSIES